jgi:LPXTG-motif cell wall-anchored protein
MRYTKRWLAGAAGLSLGLVMGMAPAAHADPITDLTSSLTQAVTGAADTAGTSAEQQGGEAAKPTATRKLQGEAPSGNTSSGTLDAGDSNGLNLGGIGITAPIIVCGNAVNVVGIGARAGCVGENGPKAGLNSADGALFGGDSNGLNIGGIAATVPIIVCGNALNVIGVDAKARCQGVNGGTHGGGGNSSAGTLDADDSNGLNIGGIAATVPVVICGNALNVIGVAAEALCEGTNGGDIPPPCTGNDDCPPSCTDHDCPPQCTGDQCPPQCMGDDDCPPPCTGDDCPPPCTGSGCNPPPCTGHGCTPPPCTGHGCKPPHCGGEHPPAGCTPPGEHHRHHHGEEAGTLPVTGLDTTGIALGGLALVGLGSGALVAARRRREV